MKKGFTLIELMIVIAICGILAAVIVPAFQDHKKQKESQRIEAQASQDENTNLGWQE